MGKGGLVAQLVYEHESENNDVIKNIEEIGSELGVTAALCALDWDEFDHLIHKFLGESFALGLEFHGNVYKLYECKDIMES